MIYLLIRSSESESANKFCRETFHENGDTFVENFEDELTGERYCVSSIPGSDTAFTKKIIEEFGFLNDDPRGIGSFNPNVMGDSKIREKFQSVLNLKLRSIVDDGV